MIFGVTSSISNILNIHLKSGRFISTLDEYERYCVIGQEVFAAMKKISFKDPLGQQLQIGKDLFTIVGIADNWQENSFVYANIDYSVMVPILTTTAISKYANINNIIMRLLPSSNISKVENHITRYLNNLLADRQISFRSAKELVAKMRKQSDILTVFLGLIGSISLFVGGIGVMNIMLVSVMERKREIGIRLAVGAKRSDIGTLFLIESVMLSLVGGIFGVLIGIFIAFMIAKWWHWPFTLFLWPPLAGFSVSVAVGIFFGFYPAYLASRLSPIDALRSE
jgi:putative ABC transport system permease protein